MNIPETLFETQWIRFQRIKHWDFVCRPHSNSCIGILAITPNNELVLVEQFRIPIQQYVIEIPAGLVGDEDAYKEESLAECATRELLEETGFRAETMSPLITSPTSAGLTSEIIHLFHAKKLVREHQGGGVGGENITVHLVPLTQLRQWLANQENQGKKIDFKIHAALWAAGMMA
jgi:ADP-ribose pyrophosphatase